MAVHFHPQWTATLTSRTFDTGILGCHFYFQFTIFMTKKANFSFFIWKPDLMLQQFNGLKSILQFHFMPLTNDLLNLLPNIVKLIGERRFDCIE